MISIGEVINRPIGGMDKLDPERKKTVEHEKGPGLRINRMAGQSLET